MRELSVAIYFMAWILIGFLCGLLVGYGLFTYEDTTIPLQIQSTATSSFFDECLEWPRPMTYHHLNLEEICL